MKQKIIIDTDCGSDDAMAIAMAMNDTKYEVLMFCTVAGNVTLKQATDNTLLTLEKVNTYFPPVYKGCATMLNKQLFYAYETHGDDGMGDYGYKPTYLKCNEENGILKMLEILEKEPNKTVDIIALGPLTNIAVAFKLKPEAMNRARNIYVMGTSGLGVGNVSPVAEFNIWQDPEAAKAVVESGFPNLYFIGWDACLDDNMLDKDDIENIKNTDTLDISKADNMVENVIGRFTLPMGVAINFKINDKDYIIPMVSEEASVIAAASNAAKLARSSGGFYTSNTGSIMIAQIQIVGVKDVNYTKMVIYENKEKILKICNDIDPVLVKFGGGALDIDVRVIETNFENMVILHLKVNTLDAMGANAVNTMAEAVAPFIETITGGTVYLRILSNLAIERLVRARTKIKKEERLYSQFYSQ